MEKKKLAWYKILSEKEDFKIVKFKSGHLMLSEYARGYVPINREDFSRVCYQEFPGITMNGISEVLDYMKHTAPDVSKQSHLIWFHDKVWDMQKLDWVDTMDGIYSTDIAPNDNTEAAWGFLLQLANGDEDLAQDYLQAMAPLLMAKRPTGVIWFIGSGANGKSSLLNALYRIFGRYFASLTPAAIEDGRAIQALKGVLGNIVRESSEARIEDSERYKAIGTHEPITARPMRTNETEIIPTDFHTIFNANNIPVFADKTHGARRRTLVVPFPAKFKDDPNFDDRTFTDEFLGGLVTLLTKKAQEIASQGYRYRWSDATINAKNSYDSEVNTAEAYFEHMKTTGIVGFLNYNSLKFRYELWCSENGLVPLGVTSLRRVIRNEGGAVRRSTTDDNGREQKVYTLGEFIPMDQINWWENGLGTLKDFSPAKQATPTQERLTDDW